MGKDRYAGTGCSGAGRFIVNATVGSKLQPLAHVRTGKVLNRVEFTDKCSRGKCSILTICCSCSCAFVETQFDINFFFFVVGSVTILIEQSRKHLNFEPLKLLDEWREVKEK